MPSCELPAKRMTASRICSGRRSARPAEVGVADSGKTGEELTLGVLGTLIEQMGRCQRGPRFSSESDLGVGRRKSFSVEAAGPRRNSRKRAQRTQKVGRKSRRAVNGPYKLRVSAPDLSRRGEVHRRRLRPPPGSMIDSFQGGSCINNVRYGTNHATRLKSGA